MATSLQQPTPSDGGLPSWLGIGVRAKDTGCGRVGIVQLIQDDAGAVRTGVIVRPTRALLRAVGEREPLWWAHIVHLVRPDGDGRGADLGLGHRGHPLLGRVVRDGASGRVGVLRAVCPEPDPRRAYADRVPQPGEGAPVAWIVPVGGGIEWTTVLGAVEAEG